ncbi:MAG: hypothetical protein JO299_06270 [Gammaproteobacteria bacterium]|nr:hypothetical protein [Gammaproteobacteria bacterium]
MLSRPVEHYDFTLLPFIPFSGTGGEALNNNDVVAGGIARSDGSVALAVWSDGVLTNLGIPPGLPTPDFDQPRVFGMNDCGTIVGTVHTRAGDLPSRCFIHQAGRFQVLPLADAADLGGAAIGINVRDQVVGYDHTPEKRVTGWLWSDGTYSRIPVAGKNTAALAINASGTIIGNRSLGFVRRVFSSRLRGSRELGYVLHAGRARYLSGFAYAINAAGVAVGGTISNGRARAALFEGSVGRVILDLPSSAVGINSSVEIVGWYEPLGEDRRHLFKWSANSGAVDLTPDGYHCAEAAAINDRGVVLGYGVTPEGKSTYFLLSPAANGAVTPRSVIGA